MPCKGYDIELKRGIDSVMAQKYTNYDFITIVASKQDEALGAINESGAKYMLSNNQKYTKGSGKVRSLTSAFVRFMDNYDIFVVVDSDTYCQPHWLSSLIMPLFDKKIGISTTFPIFKPTKNAGFWAYVKQVWGAVGSGLMQNSKTSFAWGGSMAFRTNILDKKALQRFSRSLSDDIALTQIIKEKGLRVHYIPDQIVSVPSNDNFTKFIEWSNRQTALMGLGNRKILNYGIIFYSSSLFLLISSILLSIFLNPLYLLFLIPFILGLFKTFKRIQSGGIRICMAYLIINVIYLYNLLSAKRMRTITWRGITYNLMQD